MGQGLGQRCGRICATRKDRSVFRYVGRSERPAAVVVSIAVGQQAEASRRADFEKGKGLREQREDRKEGRATPSLVGLRRSLHHDGSDLVPMCKHIGSEVSPALRHAGDVTCAGEEKVGLLLRRRQIGKMREHVRVVCDALGDRLIQR
jgi:hypothetical protein